MKRLLSNANPARSYICRFNSFNRLFNPSTGPLLTFNLRLALTVMGPETVQHPPWYVEPNEGESISHYFGRFRRHEAVCISSPGTLSKAAGIGLVLARWEKFRFNPFPSQKELEAIAKLIGLDADRIAQMLPPKGEKMKLEPIRLCAGCYAQQPYHRLEWQFQSSAGCDRHKLRLLSECPFCKERFSIPTSWERGECQKCHAPFRSMVKRQKAY